MNDIAQPMIKQVESIAPKPADTAWANAAQEMHKPIVIAGTSNR